MFAVTSATADCAISDVDVADAVSVCSVGSFLLLPSFVVVVGVDLVIVTVAVDNVVVVAVQVKPVSQNNCFDCLVSFI